MDILVSRLSKANDAYRSGRPLLMTDAEYDEAMSLLASKDPENPLLSKVRAAPVPNSKTVKMPHYLGSLDKAKTQEELAKWLNKNPSDCYVVSEKLDGISGLWSPVKNLLYLSGDDNTGLNVSAWLPHISKSPPTSKLAVNDIPSDVWIRGELIMSRAVVPPGRLGRSIVNGIFHHAKPDATEAAKVRFVAYEIIGMDPSISMRQHLAWLGTWGTWIPWYLCMKTPEPTSLTKLLAIRRTDSSYEIDGLVIRTNTTQPRVNKGNPKDAIAWKPPNGESKLTRVVRVEWNASATGKLIPRVEIEPVHLGGSTITFVTGVNARRITDWKIGPGASVIVRKGGDVIPVIDSVEVPATVVMPPDGTWVWDGLNENASNIKQISSDSTTYAAQLMKMATKLGWDGVGPAQMKSLVDAGHTTVPLLRKVPEAELVRLLGKVKGAQFYKIIQGDGWKKASEIDLFVASPMCPSGIGKSRLESLLLSEPSIDKWSSIGLVEPKGWSVDALKEFQKVWKSYEDFRMTEWCFIAYPIVRLAASRAEGAESALVTAPIQIKGTVVFSGVRDAAVEIGLAAKGYRISQTVKSDTKLLVIADNQDVSTYTSTKVEQAKKVPGCRIIRRIEWTNI